MKKTLFSLFILTLLVFFVFVFSSCGGNPETTTKPVDSTPVTTSPSTQCTSHIWDGGKTVKEAKCTEAGETLYTCQNCGETKTEPISALDHDFGEWTDVTIADCLNDGSRTRSCSRCTEVETETVSALGHKWGSVTTVAQLSCGVDGVTKQTCQRCPEVKTTTTPKTGKHTYGTTAIIGTVPTATSSGTLVYYCTGCSLSKEESYAYTDYKAKIDNAVSVINSFTFSSVGGDTITTMTNGSTPMPEKYPTSNQHPRLLFTASDIADIRAVMTDPNYASKLETLVAAANEYSSGILGAERTVGTSDRYGPKGTHNCNEAILRCISEKAFLYQITGAENYGYEAIKMILQYMTTLKMSSVNDVCRYWGYTMYVAAIVYDWCYDLMTPTTRTQMISCVEHKIVCGDHMEVGFPPTNQGGVSGHGCERQILRDYLSFAVAIYDEAPSWYNLIAGRIYKEYVPVRNEYYAAEYYPQGISNYVPIRFNSDIWSAWILQVATGENPYDDGMQKVLYSMFSHIVNGNLDIFDQGDDELREEGDIFNQLSLGTTILAHLYNDATLGAWAKFLNYYAADPYIVFISAANTVKPGENRFEGMNLIQYNDGFVEQIITHKDWKGIGASTYMRIGGRSTGNHDHADSGSFQIYYKGLLTGDSGVYDSYGSTHHFFYHKATIAHNSITINVKNRQGAIISHGQKQPGEPGSYTLWQTDDYKTGETTGVAYGYADEAETVPTYAYIAGDLAAAYDSTLVDEVTRRMLTVYDVGDDTAQLYFFVFDHVIEDSAKNYMSFLLHCPKKPTVDGMTVTISTGGAKLVLQNVTGADAILEVGGANRNFIVNDQQLTTKNGENDGYWGRVELTAAAGNAADTMLNVISVTNSGDPKVRVATSVKTDIVTGCVFENTAAIFVTEKTRQSAEFTFVTESEKTELNYYISGVTAGNWDVSVNGTKVCTAVATEEGGFLTFTAPVGNVVLTPAN